MIDKHELGAWASNVLWLYDVTLYAMTEKFAPPTSEYADDVFTDFWAHALRNTTTARYLLNSFPIEPDAQTQYAINHIEQLKEFEKFNATADKAFAEFWKGTENDNIT
jgi:hypothetical protein